MQKENINRDILQFVSRFKKDFKIQDISEIEPGILAEFNKKAYKNEFNAARYQDQKKILHFWDWKYRTNPASRNIKNFGWVANYKDKLIGQFHIMPADVKIGDNYYCCAWGSDLAILTEYRNLGISTFLIQHAREEAGRQFASFLLGGMNENSYNVFKQSGFVNLGNIPRYIKILDIKTVLRSYGLPRFLYLAADKIVRLTRKLLPFKKRMHDKAVELEMVNGFDDEFKRFWDSVAVYYRCIARRDLSFLKWRYRNQPLWTYTTLRVKRDNNMKGFAVLREADIKNGRLKGKRIGVVSDILITPQDRVSTQRLLTAILEFFQTKGVLLIKCDILNNFVEEALQKAGFWRIKSRHAFMLNLYNRNISKSDKDLAAARKNWFISSGDSDFDFD